MTSKEDSMRVWMVTDEIVGEDPEVTLYRKEKDARRHVDAFWRGWVLSEANPDAGTAKAGDGGEDFVGSGAERAVWDDPGKAYGFDAMAFSDVRCRASFEEVR